AAWGCVARWGSGGILHTDTGVGYHRGLQFSASAWQAFGGGEFAATADQASREEQIVVAERALAQQGWGAWPACSASLGLNSPATQRTAPAQSVSAPANSPAAVQKAVE